jgi:hypothetical protein
MGHADEIDGAAQKMFQDCILPIVKNRKFFLTDKGFAGVAIPMVQKGDTIALIVGMVRAAVLCEADLKELQITVKGMGPDIRFHRIAAFAEVGCHDREEFKRLEKAGPENWSRHVCLRDEMERFHII